MVPAALQPSRQNGKGRRASRQGRVDDADAIHESQAARSPIVDEVRDARTAYFSRPASERVPKASKKTTPSQSDTSKRKHQSSPSKTTHAHSDTPKQRTQRSSSSLKLSAPGGPTRRSVAVEENLRQKKHTRTVSSGGEYVYPSRHTPGERQVPDKIDGVRAHHRRIEHSRSHANKQAPVAVPRPKLSRTASTSKAEPVPSRPTLHRRETVGVETTKKEDNRKSLLNTLFRTASTPTGKPRTVECLTCGSDDVPVTRSAKLSCGHRMCNSCLKRIFSMSVTDPAHMPPRCCTEEHIPLKCVDNLFDVKFKLLWNKKYEEYTTQNPVYCPKPGCGTWIRPNQVRTHEGRKYGLCGKCKTKVCLKCNAKLHRRGECPKDEETQKLIAIAEEKGWRRCFNCRAMVEKKEGCNHMTCRCTAQFCMPCGAPWKTCDCPWFDYTQVQDGDRLNPMRDFVPLLRRHVFGEGEAPAPVPEEQRQAPNVRNPALRYQQELDLRRRQVQRDEAMARRLQFQALHGQDEPRQNVNQEVFGNAGEHFLNDNFVHEAANIVMGVLGDAGFGRRGERDSGRRRGPRQVTSDQDAGLAPNAFGTESLLGFAAPPPQPTTPRRGSTLRGGQNRKERETDGGGSGEGRGNGAGDMIGRWLSRLG
ncbi:hypothetical protein BDV97DRAFT_348882 [Delphinella strobiligena]|nr:hypothetical protein BDV97DRAFT_348882 [Delphinella strobiligena]